MSLHFPYYVNYWIIFGVLVYFTIVLFCKFLKSISKVLVRGDSYGSKVSPVMDNVRSYREGGIPPPSLRHRTNSSVDTDELLEKANVALREVCGPLEHARTMAELRRLSDHHRLGYTNLSRMHRGYT